MTTRACSLFLLAALALGCSDKKAAADQGAKPPEGQAVAMSAKGLPVDISDLRDDEQKSFFHLIQKEPSACGKAQSLEQSLRSDPKCRRSVYAARYIKHLLSLHLLESEVEEHYDERFGPVEKHDIDVSNAPVLGDRSAPVSIVEFSDFQCPHCQRLAPILERLVNEEFRGQVKLYYKSYPLSSHPDSKVAAQAAVAAGKQGKFWPYYDKIYGGNLEKEDMSTLEGYAKDLHLDMKKWKSDLDAAKDQVEKDKAEGERLDINATPTLYIDGRQFRGPHTLEEIKDWIEEDLNK